MKMTRPMIVAAFGVAVAVSGGCDTKTNEPAAPPAPAAPKTGAGTAAPSGGGAALNVDALKSHAQSAFDSAKSFTFAQKDTMVSEASKHLDSLDGIAKQYTDKASAAAADAKAELAKLADGLKTAVSNARAQLDKAKAATEATWAEASKSLSEAMKGVESAYTAAKAKLGA